MKDEINILKKENEKIIKNNFLIEEKKIELKKQIKKGNSKLEVKEVDDKLKENKENIKEIKELRRENEEFEKIINENSDKIIKEKDKIKQENLQIMEDLANKNK